MWAEKYGVDVVLQKTDVDMGNTSHAKLLQMVRPGSAVLECGPAYGIMTRYMKETLGCSVHIIEYDPDAFSYAVKFADGGVCADLENDDWMDQFEDGTFDYITYADVLEHLRDPQAVLSKMKRFLKNSGSVLLSVPNIAHGDVILNLLCDQFNYTPTGLLDSTHIHFFARKNLRKMAEEAGFYLINESGVRIPPLHSEQAAFFKMEDGKRLIQAEYGTKDIYQFVCQLTLTQEEEHSDLNESIATPLEELQRAEVQLSKEQCQVQIFFDWGEGFTEDNSQKFYYQYNEDIALTIPIEKGIKAVRIDPADSYSVVIVKKCCAVCESGILDFPCVTKGVVVGGAYLFDTQDPQFLLALPEENITEIRVVLNVSRLSQDAAEHYARQRHIEEKEQREREQYNIQAYFDTGAGFSEDESLLFPQKYGTPICLSISIPKNTKAFRIDPIDSPALVSVKKCCAVGEGKVRDLTPNSNGLKVENRILFTTNDPQLLFSPLENGLTEVRIEMDILQLSTDAAEGFARQYQREEQIRTELYAQVNSITEQLTKTQQETAELNSRLETQNVEKERLSHILEQVTGKCRELSNQLEQTTKENQGLSERLEQVTQERCGLSDQLGHVTKEHQKLSSQLELITRDKQALSEQVEQTERELYRIHNSRSWRFMSIFWRIKAFFLRK